MRLEEKYAHVTVDSIAQMTQEQLEDLRYQIQEETQTIQMQLEMLKDAGGVSRDMAGQVKDYLPSSMVLESFTGQITNTNYDMTTESLGTAAKFAIGVAVIAGLGALAFLITKMMSKGDKTPKIKQAVKTMVAVGGVQFDSNDPAQTEKLKQAVQKNLTRHVKEGIPRATALAYVGYPALDISTVLGKQRGQDTFMWYVENLPKVLKERIFDDIDYLLGHRGKDVSVNDLPSSKHSSTDPFKNMAPVFLRNLVKVNADFEKVLSSKVYGDMDGLNDFLDNYVSILNQKVTEADLHQSKNEVGAYYKAGRPPNLNYLDADILAALTWSAVSDELNAGLEKANKDIGSYESKFKGLEGFDSSILEHIKSAIRDQERILRITRKMMEASDHELDAMLRGFKWCVNDTIADYKTLYEQLTGALTDPELPETVANTYKKTIANIRTAMANAK